MLAISLRLIHTGDKKTFVLNWPWNVPVFVQFGTKFLASVNGPFLSMYVWVWKLDLNGTVNTKCLCEYTCHLCNFCEWCVVACWQRQKLKSIPVKGIYNPVSKGTEGPSLNVLLFWTVVLRRRIIPCVWKGVWLRYCIYMADFVWGWVCIDAKWSTERPNATEQF